MTVKQLRELLSEAPDDMKVLVLVENLLTPGMFAFAEACSCDTGISQLGPGEDGTGGGEDVFVVLPHGFGISEDEIDTAIVPEMN